MSVTIGRSSSGPPTSGRKTIEPTGRNEERRAREAAGAQWSNNPAGTTYVEAAPGTVQFYEQMTATRYRIQPWHPELLRRFAPTGRLLEIGCGAGTDHSELAKMASYTVGIDLAYEGARLTGDRLTLEGMPGTTLVADGECLPFAPVSFDAVYSFGVIHHTDHPETVAREMYRVMKPGGRFMVSLYHRASVVTLENVATYVRSRRFLKESWRDHLALVEVGAEELDERPLVRLYSRRGAAHLFEGFANVRTEVVHGGSSFSWANRPGIASRFGWFVIVTGTKPAG